MHAKSAKIIARWLSGVCGVAKMLNVKIVLKGVKALPYIVNNSA